jgi:hypothetical protein
MALFRVWSGHPLTGSRILDHPDFVPNDAANIEFVEEHTVMVTIKVDRRFGKEISLGEKRIEAMAADVVKNSDDVEDFVIVTKTGQKINPREIFMRSKVAIDSDGKTVNRDKAWKELLTFFNQLTNAGVLEQ